MPRSLLKVICVYIMIYRGHTHYNFEPISPNKNVQNPWLIFSLETCAYVL